MSIFTESALLKKLADLNASQQSIQTLSLWLIHHRKHHAVIVKTWARELQTGPEKKILTFMYLANDVIQNSKKKGPEYNKEFSNVLASVFKHINKNCKVEKVIASLGRILNIWEERGVYEAKAIGEYRIALLGSVEAAASSSNSVSSKTASTPHSETNGNGKAEKPDKPERSEKSEKSEKREKRKCDERGSSSSSSSKSKKVRTHHVDNTDSAETSPIIEIDTTLSPVIPLSEPPEPETLIEALANIENSASSDALARQRIANLPPELSSLSVVNKLKNKEEALQLAKEVNEAYEVINEYNNRLTAEMVERNKLAAMLIAYHNEQKELLAQAEKRQIENRKKLTTYSTLLKEVRNHLSNLPDLTHLPDVTGRLAPLPSAGDLFNKG